MRHRPAGALIASLLLLSPLVLPGAPASAEERKNSWEINLFIGQTWTGTQLDLTSAPHRGFRVGWNFPPA